VLSFIDAAQYTLRISWKCRRVRHIFYFNFNGSSMDKFSALQWKLNQQLRTGLFMALYMLNS